MMKLAWEALKDGGLEYEGFAEILQELASIRAHEQRRAWMTGPDGKMLIKLSPIAMATSGSVGLESVSKLSATFSVPATHLAGYEPLAPAEPVRAWMHGIEDILQRVELYHQNLARLDELARLQARDEHSTRRQPNAKPALRLVPIQPQPAPPVEFPRKNADRARRPSWREAVTPYIVAKLRVWKCATAKGLFAALEKEAGTPESPFDSGTGSHRGKLFVREFSQPVDLKTIQNSWQELRRAAGISA